MLLNPNPTQTQIKAKRSWLHHQGISTCMSSTNVVLHVVLLHADIVTDAAAEWEHPLLLVHMERHVADKLGIQLRLETTHMAAGQRTAREKEGRWREWETVSCSVILCLHIFEEAQFGGYIYRFDREVAPHRRLETYFHNSDTRRFSNQWPHNKMRKEINKQLGNSSVNKPTYSDLVQIKWTIYNVLVSEV